MAFIEHGLVFEQVGELLEQFFSAFLDHLTG